MREGNVIAPHEMAEELSQGATVLYHVTAFAKWYWQLQVEECASFSPKMVAQHSSTFLIPEGTASAENKRTSGLFFFFSVSIDFYFLHCGNDLI